jgi:hypothetical protein
MGRPGHGIGHERPTTGRHGDGGRVAGEVTSGPRAIAQAGVDQRAGMLAPIANHPGARGVVSRSFPLGDLGEQLGIDALCAMGNDVAIFSLIERNSD